MNFTITSLPKAPTPSSTASPLPATPPASTQPTATSFTITGAPQSAPQPSATDKIFGNATPTNLAESFLKSTIGEEGIGGLVARPIVAAETAGATQDVAQHKQQLAQTAQALLARANALPDDDPRKASLLSVVQDDQKALGIADDTMNALGTVEETQSQNVGDALNSAATLAGGETGAGKTLAQKILLSTGMGAAYGAAQPAESDSGAGKIAEGAALGAVTGAATQGALSGASALARYATQELPSDLLTSKLGFTKNQIAAGANDKATNLILDNKSVGSVSSLSKQTESTMTDLNAKISNALMAHANEGSVSLQEVADNTAARLQQSGWTATGDDVLDAAKNLLGKRPGSSIIGEDAANVVQANKLRQGLDMATKPSAFLKMQNPEQATLAMEFANSLRGVVKTIAPDTAPLFDEYSKNITLSHALDKLAAQGQKVGGLRDILSAGLGAVPGLFAGNPFLGAAAGVATERAATSLPVTTGAAVGLDQLSRLAPYLSKLSTPQRLLLMNTLGGAAGSSVSLPPNQTPPARTTLLPTQQ